MAIRGKKECGEWNDENEKLLTLFLPRITKTISSQKNIAMTTEPIGTISSALVFSSAPATDSYYNLMKMLNKNTNFTQNRVQVFER